MSWTKRMFQRLVPRTRAWGGYMTKPAPQVAAQERFKADDVLIKPRPRHHHDDYYRPLGNDREIFASFDHFRREMIHEQSAREPHSPRVIKEIGRITPERGYLYLKAFNQHGLLFEQSDDGWIISRADKMTGQDTFLKSSQTWDQVKIYLSKRGNLRLSSQRLELNYVSMNVYTQKLKESLAREWN